jgi:flagellar motor switch protein FliN/FliY
MEKVDRVMYLEAWAQALAACLAAKLGLARAADLAPTLRAAEQEPAGWVFFRFAAGAEREFALAADLPTCARLAQIEAGQPATGAAAELSGEGREAVAALLERAAAAVHKTTGIELTPVSGEPPAWRAAERAEIAFTLSGGGGLVLTSLVNAELAAALHQPMATAEADTTSKEHATVESPAEAGPAGPPPEAAQPRNAGPADAERLAPAPAAANADGAAVPGDGGSEDAGEAGESMPPLEKLGLLMDVPLDVTLRFGARQMVLKEILELMPGGVIELDRNVQDPVELMVAGQVVATGEVVIVDGNYGLRVDRISSPRQRLSGLF